MKKHLRVLIVEDSKNDADLVKLTLARSGYDVSYERIETAEAMKEALKTREWDIIITDHRMPHFSSMEALKLYHQSGMDIPFIVVSGSIGEELAVGAMKAGAHDYIVKDNLARLAPAVERELREAEVRRQKKLGENNLHETNQKLQQTMEDLQQANDKLIQQGRIRALGQMAGGVAHDFSNALAQILGFAEPLLALPDGLNDANKVRKRIEMICAVAHHAEGTIVRLREFYRPQPETQTLRPVDLNNLVRNAISLTEPKWKQEAITRGAAIEIQADLQSTCLAMGNERDLSEILTNLVFNAVDAMPQGGKLMIRTQTEKNRAVLTVGDNGTGMTPEVRQHCLEPFFTTKGERGTGLGLTIVTGLVQRIHGTLDIQSEPGRGTTFIIRLPVFAEVERRNISSKSDAPKRHLHVLIVEDEPITRGIEARYMSGEGHTVETAEDGYEGLQKFRSGRFDLVVSDHAMPRMDGSQMAEAIKEMAPSTPLILVTEFADPLKGTDRKQPRADLILPKPVTQTILRQAVGQVIPWET